MRQIAPRRIKALGFEPLEGRALLSVTGVSPHHHNEFVQVQRPSIAFSGPGEGAILSALNGGAGHEFVTLLRREVHNVAGVIRKFASGAITQYTVPGFVAKVPNAQPLYTGGSYDRMFLTEAGAILLKGSNLELAAITRGPFSNSSVTSQVVFALNRGAGSSLGPAFASRPGITPDALVTITIGPNATSYSGTITDLTTGTSQAIDPSEIQVDGPVVRVLVNASQVPSKGLPFKKYTFASWTAITPGTGISSVGSFAPEYSMIPIGVLTTVKPPRL